MQRKICFILVVLSTLTGLSLPLKKSSANGLTVWLNRCSEIATSPLTFTEFDAAYQSFIALQKRLLTPEGLWTNNNPISFDDDVFQPYTQKVVIPAGSNVYIWGDLHGDLHALQRALTKLQQDGVFKEDFTLKPNNYFLFLGDYVDRGQNGTEVIYTLMRLKLANPHQLFMARGNHEDIIYNTQRNGFINELANKFPLHLKNLCEKLPKLYSSLPIAIFLGSPGANKETNYIICCHGAIELGYQPAGLLGKPAKVFDQIEKLHCSKALAALQESSSQELVQGEALYQKIKALDEKVILSTHDMSAMWGDFKAGPGRTDLTTFSPKSGRGITYGENLTTELLNYYSKPQNWRVHAMVRGHQHNPSMPGIFKNRHNNGLYRQPWQAPIFTTVATDSMLRTDSMHGCFLQITTATNFADWQLHHQHQISAQSWVSKTDLLAAWQNNDNPVAPNQRNLTE